MAHTSGVIFGARQLANRHTLVGVVGITAHGALPHRACPPRHGGAAHFVVAEDEASVAQAPIRERAVPILGGVGKKKIANLLAVAVHSCRVQAFFG